MKVVIELPLPGFKSLCSPKAKTIVSRDFREGPVHRANNSSAYEVTHYKVDGVVITEGKKCDYLLLNEDKCAAYFIELKGQDLSWAAQQIEATETALNSCLNKYSDRKYRIVANKCRTQSIENSNFKRYREKWGAKLIYRSGLIEENL